MREAPDDAVLHNLPDEPFSSQFSHVPRGVGPSADVVIYISGVSAAHTVDQVGRYDGLTLREALPSVVNEIVSAVDPVEVIVFGSVARGEETTDSDLDLLVVVDAVDPTERRALMR